jgi:hypothetical protein
VQQLIRHFPDTEVVGRDLPSLGFHGKRNSIAADSFKAKTARCPPRWAETRCFVFIQRHERALLDPAAPVSGLGVAHDLTRVADRLQIAGDDFVEPGSFRAGDLDDAGEPPF